jgi:hypothetical protein
MLFSPRQLYRRDAATRCVTVLDPLCPVTASFLTHSSNYCTSFTPDTSNISGGTSSLLSACTVFPAASLPHSELCLPFALSPRRAACASTGFLASFFSSNFPSRAIPSSPSLTSTAPHLVLLLMKGWRSGILTVEDYYNLCQCESLEDLKLHLSGTDYGNFLQNEKVTMTRQ